MDIYDEREKVLRDAVEAMTKCALGSGCTTTIVPQPSKRNHDPRCPIPVTLDAMMTGGTPDA